MSDEAIHWAGEDGDTGDNTERADASAWFFDRFDDVRIATQRALTMQPLSSADWEELQQERQRFAKATPEEQEMIVRRSLEQVPTGGLRALVGASLLFAEDGEPFRKANYQRVLEHAAGGGLDNQESQNLLACVCLLESRSEHAQDRLQLHLVLDFLTMAMESINRDEEEYEHETNQWADQGSFSIPMMKLARDKAEKANNYLIGRKFQDIDDLANEEVREKPGALYGVAGGNSDAMIYTFGHGMDNHRLRTTYRHYDGHPNVQPLFPVAKDYVAMYERGRIDSVFAVPKSMPERDPTVLELVSRNDPELAEDIYDVLNRSNEEMQKEFPTHSLLSIGLRKFPELWALRNRVAQDGGTFYFDFDRINTSGLHPFVLGQLIHWNNELLRERGTGRSLLQSVSDAELMERVFPDVEPSFEDRYRWRMLESLSIRKKVEDDLGFDFSDEDFWEQRLLLEYLDTLPTDRVEKIKGFLERGDKKARLIALASALWDPSLHDMVLSLDAMPGIEKVFSAYADVIRSAEEESTHIERLYREANPDGSYAKEHFFRGLLTRANKQLKFLHHQVQVLEQRSLEPEERKTKLAELAASAVGLLFHADQNVRLMRDLVESLPREELAELNIERLSTLRMVGPVSAQELKRLPEFDEVQHIIGRQFPEGDDQEFTDQFLRDPSARIHYSSYRKDGKQNILGLFGLTTMKNGAWYVDWYSTNPDAVVPKLAEATLITTLRSQGYPQGLYAVVAPHVASSTTFIERLGCVAFDETDNYSRTYMKVRVHPSERGRYVSQTLASEEIETIRTLCDGNPGKLQKFEVERDGETHELQVMSVSYQNRTHKDEVNAGTTDGAVYGALRTLNAGASERRTPDWDGMFVLPRYIPAEGNTRERQTHYCVFEKSKLKPTEYDGLTESIHALHAEHDIGTHLKESKE